MVERERIGRYELIRALASGGMGDIFLAEHTGIAGFAKRVAVKRIRPELARDPNYVKLFLNEARLGSFLNHPNIVHIFDVGHEICKTLETGEQVKEDALWLVMEYVDGVDLKRLQRRASLAGTPLTPPLVAAIMIEVLSALEEAHHGGPLHGAPIIHRDMSPENVLIARSGAVKVLDFGLAKWMPESTSVPSMEGNMIFGKVRYMPPEQLKGHMIDVRADLFSLGVVMYEVLHGNLPFGRGSANQVLAEILAGPPPSPTRNRHGTDRKIDDIILTALAPELEDRYQTATEMRTALREYVEAHGRVLPLEVARDMLRPGSILAKSRGDSHLTNPPEQGPAQEHTPTEISLSVAARCGKCGGAFGTLFLDGLLLDRCETCRGVWLDPTEIERIQASESPTLVPGDTFQRAPLDQLVGTCPSCRIALHAYEVPNQPASIEICGRCLGVWLDQGELRLLSEGDVVRWLRSMIDAMSSGPRET